MAINSTSTEGGSDKVANDNTKTESAFDNVPWPVRPRDGINYDFVATLYLIGSALALAFYLLETKILAPLLFEGNNDADTTLTHSNGSENTINDGEEGNGNAWKEFASGMQGMYFIFLPFMPCLLWSLVVRHFWIKETKKGADINKKDR